MGGIVVDGGSFDVQVESGNTLFIEKGRLNWCGGKVDAQALRIAADKQDYQVNLYCQRLSLSRILEQLGAVNPLHTPTAAFASMTGFSFPPPVRPDRFS